MTHHLEFYSSHHQFYIADKSSDFATDSSNFWTQSAFDDGLAMEAGVLGIGTESYGSVKAELSILDAENITTDFEAYDHIVEAGIDVNSRILQVLSCPDSSVELELAIKPGRYRVRIYSANLASVIDDDGEDYYKIELWPSDMMERNVLKRYAASK
jgi:hypothetical protein